MNMQGLKNVLPSLMRHKLVPMLWGAHGIGKTQGVKQIAEAMGCKLVVLNAATQEPGDLVGLQERKGDRSIHLKPDWLLDEENVVYFLDELNRAHPDVIQAMFTFVLEGRIHTHTVAPNCYIVAAGNYQGGKYNVTDTMEGAWLSRFVHIDYEPSHEEIADYLDKKGSQALGDFIRRNPDLAFTRTPKADRFNFDQLTPNPRSYDNGIRPLEDEAISEDLRFELYQGIIGPTAAGRFLQDKKKQESVIGYRQILNIYSRVRERVLKATEDEKDKRFDVLTQAVDEVIYQLPKLPPLTGRQMGNLRSFVGDLPMELFLKFEKALADVIWFQACEFWESETLTKKVRSRNV